MRIIRRIIYPRGMGIQELIDTEYPIHYLEPGEVRAGFDKGTLQKAIFELTNGNVVEYERKPEEEIV